jgi:hypothetical protein
MKLCSPFRHRPAARDPLKRQALRKPAKLRRSLPVRPTPAIQNTRWDWPSWAESGPSLEQKPEKSSGNGCNIAFMPAKTLSDGKET